MKSGSYSEILSASAISGGAQVADLVIRTLRTKIVAILLGPAGVGLVSLYQAIIDTVATVSGLGIEASGVRRIAETSTSPDHSRGQIAAKAVLIASVGTGLLGAAVCIATAGPLSNWAFGAEAEMLVIAGLAVSVLVDAQTKGRLAWLRGTRRVGAMAKCQVLSSLLATMVGAVIYMRWGRDGIVPVFWVSSLVSLAVAWSFTAASLPAARGLSWGAVRSEVQGLLRLGLALMWGTVVLVASTLAVKAIVVRELGLREGGFYQAAWSLSGLFSGFILSAMALDFYPRLTASAGDDPQLNRLVSEQLEVAVLLAVPCLLGTLALGPSLIVLFYSSGFAPAATLLPWLTLGVFVQVLSWPLGFIQLAKGAGLCFAATQTGFAVLHVLGVYVGIRQLGLTGAGVAFGLSYLVYLLMVLAVAYTLSNYRWSGEVRRLLMMASAAMTVGAYVAVSVPTRTALVICSALALASAFYSAHALLRTLGPAHPLSMALRAVPGLARTTRT